VSYRQVSLFSLKPVGREHCSSDVFYIHAWLLERSCCLNYTLQLGTVTCLPIIDELNNDLSAYVATNVISITDGQLYFILVAWWSSDDLGHYQAFFVKILSFFFFGLFSSFRILSIFYFCHHSRRGLISHYFSFVVIC